MNTPASAIETPATGIQTGISTAIQADIPTVAEIVEMFNSFDMFLVRSKWHSVHYGPIYKNEAITPAMKRAMALRYSELRIELPYKSENALNDMLKTFERNHTYPELMDAYDLEHNVSPNNSAEVPT